MKSRLLAIACAAVAAGGMVTYGAANALASGDSGDNLSPANTSVNVVNSGNIKFAGKLNGVNVTITCTSVSFSFTTPASGLAAVNLNSLPSFTSCTDTLGGTDTISTNSTNGNWTIEFVDNPSEGSTETTGSSSGDKVTLTVPKAGVTFSTTALPGCVVTASPSGSTGLTAPYDDISKATYSTVSGGNSIATSGNSSCGSTSTSGTITGSFVVNGSTGVHDTA